jgi:SPP1 gp7 family putative phage head morphogenesis protein
MPFIFAKNEGPRNPLTAQELQLAQTLYNAISRSSTRITLAEIVAILEKLQPDTLNELLNRITLATEQGGISSNILNSIDLGGQNALKQIQSIAPQLALPAFLPSKVNIGNSDAMQNVPVTRIPMWAAPVGQQLPAQLNISFNRTNPYAIEFAQRRAAELIKSIDDLTRQSVHKIINEAFIEQIDYRATAKRIKNVVGLHPKWADAVVKFEQREYTRLVKQGLKEGAARIKAQSNAATYSDRLRGARANMIARTEINIAQNEGRMQGWNQAFEQGFIDPASLKMWMTAKDERTCDVCGPMDGEIVPWDGLFSTGDKVPGRVHPHCRCSMVILPPNRKGQSFKENYDLLSEFIGWGE